MCITVFTPCAFDHLMHTSFSNQLLYADARLHSHEPGAEYSRGASPTGWWSTSIKL
jgi:hypothetical protein